MNILAEVGLSVERSDGDDPVALLLYAILAIEPGVADDRDFRFLHPRLVDVLGHVRLEDPHRAVGAVEGLRALAFVAELFPFLPAPCLGFVIVLPDAMVELPREAANHRLVAGVGPAKPAGGESAQMLLRADHHDGFVHPLGLNRGGDRARGTAVDQNV